MYHTQAFLRFTCTSCGLCCYGSANAYIAVNSTEIMAIQRYLGYTEEQFHRQYLTCRIQGGWGIRLLKDGRCSLLGEDNRCRVYPVRPVQCQTYPWWPEILNNKRSWDNESRRCEGINHGDIVERSLIEQELQRSIDAEKSR